MARVRSPRAKVAVVEVSPDAFAAAQTAVQALLASLEAATLDAAALTQALMPIASMSMDDKWVQSHGETMCKREAAKVMNISVGYLNKLIEQDEIKLTPDGRVLTRSACAWATGANRKPRRRAQATP